MTAPTFVQEVETAFNSATSPKTTASISVLAGDILVAYSVKEGNGNAATAVSGGSLTWTLRRSVNVTDYTEVNLWTAVVDSDKSMTVSFTDADGAGLGLFFGGGVINFRASDGVGDSAVTNVSSGAPSLAITTTQADSALVAVNGDWNAADGASRTWRTVNSITPTSGNGGERTYFRDSSRYTLYAAYWSDAGAIGSKTVGLSAPGSQKYSIAVVEIKGAGAGATIVGVPVMTHSYAGVVPQVRARVAPSAVAHTYTAQAPQVRARVMPAAVAHSYSAVAPQVRARVMPGVATHTYLGRTPTTTVGARVQPDPAAHTYAAQTPQVRARIAPGAATHTYAGQVPQLRARVQPGAATHVYAGLAPGISAGNSVIPPAATHVYLGIAPQLRAMVVVPTRAHTYAMQTPQVRQAVGAPAAGHTYTAQPPQLRSSVSVPASNHTYVAHASGVVAGNAVSAPVATHAYTGRLPQVFGAVTVSVPVAAHSYTAVVPAFVAGGPAIFGQTGGARPGNMGGVRPINSSGPRRPRNR